MSDKANNKQTQEAVDIEPTYTNQELQQMLTDKILELADAQQQLVAMEKEVVNVKNRSLKVYEENALLKASPEIAADKARMDYELAQANHFIESGAFPQMKPAQAYTLIRAGAEMGLKPLQSMRSLYIVKGAIKPFGNFMIARIKENGYQVEFLNESDEQVTVHVWKQSTGEDFQETIYANDPTIRDGKAIQYAKFNKLRYHATRRIVDFYLPHLFQSITDTYSEYFVDDTPAGPGLPEPTSKLDTKAVSDSKERKRLLAFIEKATTTKKLATVFEYTTQYDALDEYNAKFAELSKAEKDGTEEE